MQVVSGFEYIKYLEMPSKLCYIAPYRVILNSYGIDITEEFLFGICQGIFFEFSFIHENRRCRDIVSSSDYISIEGSRDIRNEIFDIWGILLYQFYKESKDEAHEFCVSEILNNRFVIAFFDVYYLRYHPEYNKIHGQTSAIIYGVNLEKDTFYILDQHVTTIPTSVYMGEIKKGEFELALVWGDNIFNDYKIGIVASEKKSVCQEKNILKCIKENAELMLKSKGCAGITGMFNLAKVLSDWYLFWDRGDLNRVSKSAYLHINGRGGPTASRKLYSEFLMELGIDSKYDVKNISGEFSNLAKRWNAIAIKFFRKTVDYGLIGNELIDVGKREEELYFKILNWKF